MSLLPTGQIGLRSSLTNAQPEDPVRPCLLHNKPTRPRVVRSHPYPSRLPLSARQSFNQGGESGERREGGGTWTAAIKSLHRLFRQSFPAPLHIRSSLFSGMRNASATAPVVSRSLDLRIVLSLSAFFWIDVWRRPSWLPTLIGDGVCQRCPALSGGRIRSLDVPGWQAAHAIFIRDIYRYIYYFPWRDKRFEL